MKSDITEKVDVNIEYGHIYLAGIDISRVFGQEQIQGIAKVNELISRLEAEGKTYSLCVLIDDYEYPARVPLNEFVKKFEEHGRRPDFIMMESVFAKGPADMMIEAVHSRFLKKEENRLLFSTKAENLLLWTRRTEMRDDRDFLQVFLERHIPSATKVPSRSKLTHALKRRYQFSLDALLATTINEAVPRYSCALLTACWYLMRLDVEPFKECVDSLLRLSSKPFFGDRLITILPTKYIRLEAIAMELISAAASKRIKKRQRELEYIFF